ncbi:MAG: MFS transporter, partial [Sphingobium sp.]
GFSLGTMTGGALAATLLEPYGWRAMFMATALLNTATFVLVLLFVTESPSFLIAKAGAGALEKLNRVFARLGQEPLTQLPEMPEGRKKSRVSTLMSTGGAKSTILLWASQFIFAVISYLILNWKPTVLVNTGLTPTEAGYAGLASGAAGVVGHIVIGFTSREGREVSSTAFFFLLLCISLLLFALLPPTPWGLILSAGFTSFCNVGVFTGLVLIAIALYPPQVRTTSVGVLIGISRLGAITGPLFGGLLLELGFERMGMFVLLAGLSILPIIAMRFVGLPSRQPKAA